MGKIIALVEVTSGKFQQQHWYNYSDLNVAKLLLTEQPRLSSTTPNSNL